MRRVNNRAAKRILPACAAAAMLVWLTFPAVAGAASVDVRAASTGGLLLRFVAASSEPNRLEISTQIVDGATYYLFKETAGVQVDLGDVGVRCTSPDAFSVRCSARGVTTMEIQLNDLDDHLVIQDGASPPGPSPGELRTVEAFG